MPSSAPLNSMPSGRAVSRARKPTRPPTTLLQRVILPRQADPLAVRALYVDEQSATARWVRPGAGTVDGGDTDLEITVALPNVRRVRFEKLPTALGEVRARLAEFSDGQVVDSQELQLPATGQRLPTPPNNPISTGATLFKRLVHQLRPADARAHRHPQLSLAREDARWFVLAGMDGVTVPTADGRGVTYRKRDSKVFRSMMVRSVALHRKLAREFPGCAGVTALLLRSSVADLVGSGCSTVDGATKSLR